MSIHTAAITTPTPTAPRCIARGTECEFWQVGDTVYRRQMGSYVTGTNGAPLDLRWECSLAHFNHFRHTAYDWATPVLPPRPPVDTRFAVRNVAKAAAYQGKGLSDRLCVAFDSPAGRSGTKVRTLKYKVERDGSVTVRCYRGVWRVSCHASPVLVRDLAGPFGARCHFIRPDGRRYKYTLHFKATHLRWLDGTR